MTINELKALFGIFAETQRAMAGAVAHLSAIEALLIEAKIATQEDINHLVAAASATLDQKRAEDLEPIRQMFAKAGIQLED